VNLGSSCHAASIRFVDFCCRSTGSPFVFALNFNIREISDRGMPVDAAIPEILTRWATSSCRAATLLTAACLKIDCSSLVPRPASITNPANGSKSCRSAFRATTRTSLCFAVTVRSDSSIPTLVVLSNPLASKRTFRPRLRF